MDNPMERTRDSQSRLAKWDNVKFVLIFLVVLGHALRSFITWSGGFGRAEYFIYIFHMPAFVFVSGLFSKRTVDEKRWNKVLSYVIIFYFMKVTMFLIYRIGGKTPSFSLLSDISVAWYAIGMVLFMTITIGLRHFSYTIVLPLSLLIGCIIGYDKSVGSFLALSRVITFYPFFYLGYCLDIEKLSAFLRRKWVVIASAVWLVALAGVVFKYYDKLKWSFGYFLKAKGSFAVQFKGCTWISSTEYAWLVRAGYYVIVGLTVLAVIALIPSVRCVFSKWGSKTLQVYIVHELFLYTTFTLLGRREWLLTLSPKVAFVLVFALAVAVTLLLSGRWMEPVIRLLTGGQSKREKRHE